MKKFLFLALTVACKTNGVGLEKHPVKQGSSESDPIAGSGSESDPADSSDASDDEDFTGIEDTGSIDDATDSPPYEDCS